MPRTFFFTYVDPVSQRLPRPVLQAFRQVLMLWRLINVPTPSQQPFPSLNKSFGAMLQSKRVILVTRAGKLSVYGF